MPTAGEEDWQQLFEKLRAVLPGGWMYEASWAQFDPPSQRELLKLVNWLRYYADALSELAVILEEKSRVLSIKPVEHGPAIGRQIPQVRELALQALTVNEERCRAGLKKLTDNTIGLQRRLERERQNAMNEPWQTSGWPETPAIIRERARSASLKVIEIRAFANRPRTRGQPQNKIAPLCGAFMAHFEVSPSEMLKRLRGAGFTGLPTSKTLKAFRKAASAGKQTDS